MDYKILVINTGSTSTKVSVFENEEEVFKSEITHTPEELAAAGDAGSRAAARKRQIDEALARSDIRIDDADAVAARGGTFGRVHGGAYIVDDALLEACRNPVTKHASNLSAIIAKDYADAAGCSAYIYDAVCTDEVDQIARVTGLKGIERRVFSHTLNTRAAARMRAAELGCPYEKSCFIVAHLGGGMSINVHKNGRIVDLVTDDDGAMSPERCGRINTFTMVKLCFDGKYESAGDMMKKLKGGSGLLDHLGTTDLRSVEKMIEEGDEYASFILDAMAYQISKDICSLAAVNCGKIDSIIITGGCAHDERLVNGIKKRVSFIADVAVYPGSMEMPALASGVERVLKGQEKADRYSAGQK